MAGKPQLPRTESVGAGCCWKGIGMGGLGEGGGQGDHALLAGPGWRSRTALHRAWGVVGRGMRQSGKLGGWDPPQSPASFSSKEVSPLVAFSAVLEAFFFFFLFWVFGLAELWRRCLELCILDLHLGLVKVRLRRTAGYPHVGPLSISRTVNCLGQQIHPLL